MVSGSVPTVSVVIASVNGASYLDLCLAALGRQRGDVPAEVVVADCCGPSTRELVAREYPAVRFLSFDRRLPIPELRAIGIAHSRGELVAVTEDHCIPAEDWFERIVAAHRGPYAAVGGAVENVLARSVPPSSLTGGAAGHRPTGPGQTGRQISRSWPTRSTMPRPLSM